MIPNTCKTHHLAEQTRLLSHFSSIQTLHSFDLIYCDVWGPLRITTHTGAHYFLILVDDYTQFTWMFLMKIKSKTQGLLKTFISFLNT